MRKKIAILSLMVFFAALAALAQTSSDITNIPPPEKFNFTWSFFLGLMAGVIYKATIGTIKNLYKKKFSWKKLIYPVIITVFAALPTIVFLLPHLAGPSGKFLADFLYAFVVSYVLIDFSADISKLGALVTYKLESKTKEEKEE
jgi:drug/metabolite transporter (DMT)-like permease